MNGRQVLIPKVKPGSWGGVKPNPFSRMKAAPHPWARRLFLLREGHTSEEVDEMLRAEED